MAASWINALRAERLRHTVEVIVLGGQGLRELSSYALSGDNFDNRAKVTVHTVELLGIPVAAAKVRYLDSLVELHCRDEFDRHHVITLR